MFLIPNTDSFTDYPSSFINSSYLQLMLHDMAETMLEWWYKASVVVSVVDDTLGDTTAI